MGIKTADERLASRVARWEDGYLHALDAWIDGEPTPWLDPDSGVPFREQWASAHPKPTPPPRRRNHPSIETIACWGCGRDDMQPLEKAHIKAHSRDGGDEPSNFFLLCGSCHIAQELAFGLEGTRKEHHQWLRELVPAHVPRKAGGK